MFELLFAESQVSLTIQQEGSRPVGTHAQPEFSCVNFSSIWSKCSKRWLTGEGGTSAHTASREGPPIRSQIHDEAADDDVIISSAREFEQVSIVF